MTLLTTVKFLNKEYSMEKVNRVGLCVQIGLDFTAEMAYLTRDDWRKQTRKTIVPDRIPKSVAKDFDSWEYIGIDSNQESVDKLQEQFPNQTFVCAEIKDGKDLDNLYKEIGISKVDVLKVDIEGDEYNLFNSYCSDIVPTFVSVECHRWYHHEHEMLNMHARNNMQGFERGNGYELFREIHTNTQVEYPTVELQYLKKDKHAIQVKSLDTLNLHLLGLPHTILRPDFNACAFTMKMLRFEESMHDRGHNIRSYGNEGAQVKGEFTQVAPKEFYEEHFGRNVQDVSKVYDIHEYEDFTRTYNMKMCSEVRMRARPGDIVLINYGAWCDQIVEMLADIPNLIICEMSIGYGGAMFAPFKVFESYSNQEFTKGQWDKVWQQWAATNRERISQNLEEYNATLDAVPNTTPQFLDEVVPIFLDPRQFDYKEEKGDYYLFLGRIQWTKGVDLAIKTCEAKGEKLIIAGQVYEGGFKEEIGYDMPSWVEFVGHANVEQRRELMANAKGGFVPTYYPEPGGHVLVEYLLSGTPLITTDWGNMPNVNLNGITGYRVRSGKEAELAIDYINNGMIEPKNCRKWGMNFTMNRHARTYEYYFRRIRDYVMAGKPNDLYYDHKDVDLSIRDYIHPMDSRYDIDLNLIEV